MTGEDITAILIIIAVVYLVIRDHKRMKASPVTRAVPKLAASRTEPSQQPAASDPFLDDIEKAHVQFRKVEQSSWEQKKRDLKEKFGDDVKLKRRLSDYARSSLLDVALIAVWKEIRCYPAWSKRADFGKWDKLGLKDISGQENEGQESVKFSYKAQSFTITHRKLSSSWDESTSAYLTFLEDDDEVFGIKCELEYGEWDTKYRCFDISAFKKRGNWPQVLLDCYYKIRIKTNEASTPLEYLGTEEIKGRFEE